ncbi:MAG: hypothetical protein JW920_06010 [Deltaproteobacteria bacterium]|nr:hypothetical protein [Deltaproteobacteria bacterium]
MKKKVLSLTGILFMVLMASLLWAGQVVTEEQRLWAQNALAQEKALGVAAGSNTVAVLYFHNKSGKSRLNPLQKGLAFMLMTDLSRLEQIQLLERVKLQALFEELDLGVSGLVDAETAPRVGKLAGARYLVGGDILASDLADLGIRSDLLDVPDESLLGQPLREGALSELLDLEKQILFEIIALLEVELSAQQKHELEKPLTANIKALFNLFYAIDSTDRGQYYRAQAYYQKALRQDPELRPAQEGLDELQSLNLVGSTNRSKEMLKSLEEKTSQTDSVVDDDTKRRSKDPGDLGLGQIRVNW